jgi:hypothetical protein
MSTTVDSVERDRQALDLRMQGRSFSHIAKALEFPRAVDANEAFNRALRRCSDKERKTLTAKELKRLDALAEAEPPKDEENAAKRARAIKGLRARLLAE